MGNPPTNSQWIPLVKQKYFLTIRRIVNTSTFFFLKLPSLSLQTEILHQKHSTFSHSGISSKHQMKRDWNREWVLLFLILFCACHHAATSDIEITQPWNEQKLSLRTIWQVKGQLLDWNLLNTHYCRWLWKFSICLLQLKVKHNFLSYLYHIGLCFSTFEMRNKTKPYSLFENICMIQP